MWWYPFCHQWLRIPFSKLTNRKWHPYYKMATGLPRYSWPWSTDQEQMGACRGCDLAAKSQGLLILPLLSFAGTFQSPEQCIVPFKEIEYGFGYIIIRSPCTPYSIYIRRTIPRRLLVVRGDQRNSFITRTTGLCRDYLRDPCLLALDIATHHHQSP